jgi:hypothetical protein
MTVPYMLFRAERIKTLAEQREEDRVRAELAMALARPWLRRRGRRAGGARHGRAVFHLGMHLARW